MARRPTPLKRAAPKRQPYDYVLIVCEGSKTEPNYLHELIATEQLSGANVIVTGEGGSAPINVVQDAITRFEREPEFDRVYCVFDKDTHTTYAQALRLVASTTLRRKVDGKRAGTVTMQAITSVPCFEFWVLLHFVYTTAPFLNYDALRPRLRQCPGLSDYEKGRRGLYAFLKLLQPDALRNADLANAAAAAADTDNPSTCMNTLVRQLLALQP